ncbi:hypothetical protein RI367_003992 [Sorochytrium milnesiophthora]
MRKTVASASKDRLSVSTAQGKAAPAAGSGLTASSPSKRGQGRRTSIVTLSTEGEEATAVNTSAWGPGNGDELLALATSTNLAASVGASASNYTYTMYPDWMDADVALDKWMPKPSAAATSTTSATTVTAPGTPGATLAAGGATASGPNALTSSSNVSASTAASLLSTPATGIASSSVVTDREKEDLLATLPRSLAARVDHVKRMVDFVPADDPLVSPAVVVVDPDASCESFCAAPTDEDFIATTSAFTTRPTTIAALETPTATADDATQVAPPTVTVSESTAQDAEGQSTHTSAFLSHNRAVIFMSSLQREIAAALTHMVALAKQCKKSLPAPVTDGTVSSPSAGVYLRNVAPLNTICDMTGRVAGSDTDDRTPDGGPIAAEPGVASELYDDPLLLVQSTTMCAVPAPAYPWDRIYPKGKNDLPAFNPAGKYAVKLFWCGNWRRVVVDDRVPVDSAGKPLILSHPSHLEIWPLILTKALMKLACMSYTEDGDDSSWGDFCPLHALTGWLPETVPVPSIHRPLMLQKRPVSSPSAMQRSPFIQVLDDNQMEIEIDGTSEFSAVDSDDPETRDSLRPPQDALLAKVSAAQAAANCAAVMAGVWDLLCHNVPYTTCSTVAIVTKRRVPPPTSASPSRMRSSHAGRRGSLGSTAQAGEMLGTPGDNSGRKQSAAPSAANSLNTLRTATAGKSPTKAAATQPDRIGTNSAGSVPPASPPNDILSAVYPINTKMPLQSTTQLLLANVLKDPGEVMHGLVRVLGVCEIVNPLVTTMVGDARQPKLEGRYVRVLAPQHREWRTVFDSDSWAADEHTVPRSELVTLGSGSSSYFSAHQSAPSVARSPPDSRSGLSETPQSLSTVDTQSHAKRLIAISTAAPCAVLSDMWLPFETFVANLMCLRLYHLRPSFKYSKTLSHFPPSPTVNLSTLAFNNLFAYVPSNLLPGALSDPAALGGPSNLAGGPTAAAGQAIGAGAGVGPAPPAAPAPGVGSALTGIGNANAAVNAAAVTGISGQQDAMTRTQQILYIPTTVEIGDADVVELYVTFSSCGRPCHTAFPFAPPSLALEEYSWKTLPLVSERPVLKVSANGTRTVMVRVRPSQARAWRIVIDAPVCYHLLVSSQVTLSLDEDVKYLAERWPGRVLSRDFEEPYPPLPFNSWNLLFKQLFHLPAPTFLAPQLFLPEYLAPFTTLHVHNNDTLKETPTLVQLVQPQLYEPNKGGYTVVAQSKYPFGPRAPGKYRLRFLSEVMTPIIGAPPPVPQPEKLTDLCVKTWSQELEETYVPNHARVLFRQILRVSVVPESHMSFYATINVPSVIITLQLFEGAQEIYCSRGRGSVSIPEALLQRTDDVALFAPVPGIENVKTEKEATTKEKGGAAAATSKAAKEAEKAAAAAVAAAAAAEKERMMTPLSALPVPKIKYVLQATIDSDEPIMVNQADSARGAGVDKLRAAAIQPTTAASASSVRPRAGSVTASALATSAAATSMPLPAQKVPSGKKKKPDTAAPASAMPPIASGVTAGTSSSGNVTSATTQQQAAAPAVAAVDLVWRLRMISSEAQGVYVFKDTEKEDRYRATKESWESGQPGRSAKARDAREQYLKLIRQQQQQQTMLSTTSGANSATAVSVAGDATASPATPPAGGHTTVTSASSPTTSLASSGAGQAGPNAAAAAAVAGIGGGTATPGNMNAIPPLAPSKAEFKAAKVLLSENGEPLSHVLSKDDYDKRREMDDELLRQFDTYYESMIRGRRNDNKQTRVSFKQTQQERFDERVRELQQWRDFDNGRRGEYRARVIRDIEDAMARQQADLTAAEQALAEAERAEEIATAARDKPKKKK